MQTYAGILLLFLWIFGKPAFFDAFFLFEEFADAPKGREGKDTKEDGEIGVCHKERTGNTGEADEQVHPPYLRAEIILRFDYYRVPETDTKKGAKAKNKSFEIHVKLLNC